MRSDAWLVLAARLGEICRQLGLATYYLYEWGEPDDAQVDVDDYKDPGDEQLDRVTLCRLRSLRQHRRTQRSPKLYEDLTQETITKGQLITVLPEMLRELRNGLHTFLGNVAQEISQITDCEGRERHPEWYSEPREIYLRTCALLDLIGWGAPKHPAALHLDLSKHRQAVIEALDVRLGVAADDLKEAEEVDTERAERGESPKQEQTTQRVRTLRECAAAVNDLAEDLTRMRRTLDDDHKATSRTDSDDSPRGPVRSRSSRDRDDGRVRVLHREQDAHEAGERWQGSGAVRAIVTALAGCPTVGV